MKTCTKCHIEKDESEFRLQYNRNSLRPYCRKCNAEMAANYRKKYPARAKKSRKLSYEKNKERNRHTNNKRAIEYYIKNRDEILEKKKERWKKRGVLQRKERRKNPEVKRMEHIQNLRRERSRIDRITDTYVKKLLIQKGNVPKEMINVYPEIIELHRLQLKTKRLIKNSKQ